MEEVLKKYGKQERLENGSVVSNEFMYELCKAHKASKGQFSAFYEVICNLIPLNLFEDFAAVKAKTFEKRIEKFYKKARNAKKNSSTEQEFMSRDFLFTEKPVVALPDTPIKAGLRVVIKEQDDVIKKAKLDAEISESTIDTLEGDISEAGCKIISLEEDLTESEIAIKVLESEKFQLHRRSAGLKSGFARHRCSTPLPQDNKNTSTKSSMTEIQDISTDLVVLEESAALHTGKRFFKYDKRDDRKKLTSGFKGTYAEIPVTREPSSKINKKEIQKRAKFGMKLIAKISSPEENDEETKLVLTEMIKQNRDLFLRAAESAGMPILQMLSPEQAVNLKSLMRLPMTAHEQNSKFTSMFIKPKR